MARVWLRVSARPLPQVEWLTLWPTEWLNLLQAPEIQSSRTAQTLQNFIIYREWELTKMKWRTKLFDTDSWSWIEAWAVTMLIKYDTDNYIFWVWQTVAFYNVTAWTYTVLKSNFVISAAWSWAKYWDHVFVWNWSDEVFRVSPSLWPELITNWDFATDTDWTKTWSPAPTISWWAARFT